MSSLNIDVVRGPYSPVPSIFWSYLESGGIGIPDCKNTPSNINAIYQKCFNHYQNDAYIISYVRRTINHFTLISKLKRFWLNVMTKCDLYPQVRSTSWSLTLDYISDKNHKDVSQIWMMSSDTDQFCQSGLLIIDKWEKMSCCWEFELLLLPEHRKITAHQHQNHRQCLYYKNNQFW